MKSFFFVLLSVMLLTGAGCALPGQKSKVAGVGGVWKSTDGAKTFAFSGAVPTVRGTGSLANLQILALEIDPADPRVVYAGTASNGLFVSYDAGASWTQSPDARMKQGAVMAVAVDPEEKCRVYAARPDRIVRTQDCNRTFDRELYVESKEGVTLTSLEVDWYNPVVLYAGTSDGALLRSEDRGATWATMYRGRQAVTSILVSNADSRIVMAGVAGGGVVRSVDAGETWEGSLEELKPYRDAARVMGLSQSATGEVAVASTLYGLLRSVDFGDTWEPMTLLTAPREVVIKSVVVDPADGEHILYSVGNALYETVDGGTNWAVKKLKTDREITGIVFDATDSNMVYLGLRKVETK